MKRRQTPIQTKKETMPSQMSGLLPHAAVARLLSIISSNVSAETHFGHDFSQVGVRPSAPIIGQNYSNAFCPLFPQRCPFGGACHTCSPPRVQAKLNIGQPGDKCEQVAEQVMRMPESGCFECMEEKGGD